MNEEDLRKEKKAWESMVETFEKEIAKAKEYIAMITKELPQDVAVS